jgi:hypothetical protein
MKIAVFSESPADEQAVRVLVEAVLGRPTNPVSLAGLRSRGWPAVLRTLPTIIRQLHYHGDADGLVVVADSDDSPIHDPSHEVEGAAARDCRLCQIRSQIAAVQRQLTPVSSRPPLKVAAGLAVPAIEAWLLVGSDVHVTELAWSRSLSSTSRPYTRRDLKRRLYGAEPVPLKTETEHMIKQANRLAADLSPLMTHFPIGFGALADAVRRW